MAPRLVSAAHGPAEAGARCSPAEAGHYVRTYVASGFSRTLGLLLAIIAALGLTGFAQSAPARRIVSLVPALTEILFAIGAGPQVVGVSSFDEFPPEVTSLPRVGALLDPDVERILTLRPNLVITYGSQVDLQTQMQRAAIATYDYRHGGLDHIFTTIRELGDRTGHAGEAAALAGAIESRIAAVKQRVARHRRPRTLLVFGREPGSLRNIYVSAGRGFLHDMLEAAGGDDVFAEVQRESLQATTETILARAPEVILEIRSQDGPAGASLDAVVRTNVFLTDLALFPRMNAVYGRYFTSDPKPARSTIGVAALPLGSRVEIEAVAALR